MRVEGWRENSSHLISPIEKEMRKKRSEKMCKKREVMQKRDARFN